MPARIHVAIEDKTGPVYGFGGKPLVSDNVISNDLPADAIGEYITELVNYAWKCGADPAANGFRVIVTFS